MITFEEALERTKQDGRPNIAAAELMVCDEIVTQLEGMAAQIITPVKSKARDQLQSAAFCLRNVLSLHRAMDQACATLDRSAKELAESCEWFIRQFQGDSGTGHSHWEQFPEYNRAIALVDLVVGRKIGGPCSNCGGDHWRPDCPEIAKEVAARRDS